jgi:ribosomal protein S18 acetylase RimI-like enzyme
MEVRLATPDDLPVLLPLVERFWAFERLPWNEVDVCAVLAALLADATLGRVLLAWRDDRLIGYLTLTFGYSIEHRGRDALVDELYVEPDARALTAGTQLLESAAELCRAMAITRVHLEVDHTNPRAHALYARLGFRGQARQLLTRSL